MVLLAAVYEKFSSMPQGNHGVWHRSAVDRLYEVDQVVRKSGSRDCTGFSHEDIAIISNPIPYSIVSGELLDGCWIGDVFIYDAGDVIARTRNSERGFYILLLGDGQLQFRKD